MQNQTKSHSILTDRLYGNPLKKVKKNLRDQILEILITDYGYLEDFDEAKILETPDKSGETLPQQHGIVFVNSHRNPYAFISVAKIDSADPEAALRVVFEKYSTLSLGVATNGDPNSTIFLRRNNYSGDLEYIADFEAAFPKNIISSKPFINSLDNHRLGCKPLSKLTDNIENLFFDIHSNLRDIDGLHPDEALDELSKLIYLKLYDEQSTATNDLTSFQKSLYSSKEEMASSLRALYTESCIKNTENPSKLSSGRSNYLRLSSNALYNSVLALEGYAISKSNTDLIGRAFQKVLDKVVRYGMGQYFTPEPIINLIVDICQPKVTDNIIDPFCGSAHFLTRSLKFVKQNLKPEQIEEFQRFTHQKLHGIEKSDRMVRIVRTESLLYGNLNINVRCSDALLNFSNYPDIEPESFEVVLTNPPFGSQLTFEAIQQLGEFDLAQGKRTVPLEILGLERCLQLTKHGGRIAIVVPDSVLSNKATNYVRNWITTKAKVRAIISLPIETFTPFGANIKTSILLIRKWQIGELQTNDYEVMLAKVDNVGYDSSGKALNKNDLEEVSSSVRAFLKKHGW